MLSDKFMRRAGGSALAAVVVLAALAWTAGAGAAGERAQPLRALHRIAKPSGDPPAA